MVRCIRCNGGKDRVTMTKTVINTPNGKTRIYKCPICNAHFPEAEIIEKYPWVKGRRWTWQNKGGDDL